MAMVGDLWHNQLWQWLETYGITSYGNGWRQDVINQCLEFMNSKYFFVLRPPDQEETGNRTDCSRKSEEKGTDNSRKREETELTIAGRERKQN